MALFERPARGERALLVHLDLGDGFDTEALDELQELALAAGAEPLAIITGARRAPDSKYFVGSGKADEIRAKVAELDAELVLVNHALSPSQERNLEQLLQCRVLDRTGLILDIFALRARSHEGKLQVELAQLRHLATRLVRGWTHLERQKGGIGLRGPGESQLETDRRLIRQRIRTLGARLEKVRRQRDQGRRQRQRNNVPTVSLVGYTNAGKSTLFNALTGAQAYQADQLFATLDPTVRRLARPQGMDALPELVLADTVGFIRHLPHDLVAAFRSTLQETRDADLLLHVIDVQGSEREQRIATVNGVLEEIGAQAVPQIEVYNKIDLTDIAPRIETDAAGRPQRAWISAHSGAGLPELVQAVLENLRNEQVDGWLILAPAQARLRARLFDLGAVSGEQQEPEGGWCVHINMPRQEYQRLCQREGLAPGMIENWN